MIFLLSLFLLALFVLFLWSELPRRQFEWLNASQFERIVTPGPLARFKNKVIALAPWFRRFQSNQTNIEINLHVMTFIPTATVRAELGQPAYTNSAGARCWILPSALGTPLRQRLHNSIDDSIRWGPEGTTEDGHECVIEMFSQMEMPDDIHFITAIDILPKLSSGSANLFFSAASIAEVYPISYGFGQIFPVVTKSNFLTACRVLVPDGGAVVIDCGRPPNADPTNRWLLVSPTLVDPAGIPLKK
jgi:hypothetical protein